VICGRNKIMIRKNMEEEKVYNEEVDDEVMGCNYAATWMEFESGI